MSTSTHVHTTAARGLLDDIDRRMMNDGLFGPQPDTPHVVARLCTLVTYRLAAIMQLHPIPSLSTAKPSRKPSRKTNRKKWNP